MTYKEVVLAIRGYENKQLRDWERARLIAYQVYASTPKKRGDSNKPIQQYLPLPSDRARTHNIDPERFKAQRELFIKKQLEKDKLN